MKTLKNTEQQADWGGTQEFTNTPQLAMSWLTIFLFIFFNLTDLNVIWELKVVTEFLLILLQEWKELPNTQREGRKDFFFFFFTVSPFLHTAAAPRKSCASSNSGRHGTLPKKKLKERNTFLSILWNYSSRRVGRRFTLSLSPLATWSRVWHSHSSAHQGWTLGC